MLHWAIFILAFWETGKGSEPKLDSLAVCFLCNHPLEEHVLHVWPRKGPVSEKGTEKGTGGSRGSKEADACLFPCIWPP